MISRDHRDQNDPHEKASRCAMLFDGRWIVWVSELDNRFIYTFIHRLALFIFRVASHCTVREVRAHRSACTFLCVLCGYAKVVTWRGVWWWLTRCRRSEEPRDLDPVVVSAASEAWIATGSHDAGAWFLVCLCPLPLSVSLHTSSILKKQHLWCQINVECNSSPIPRVLGAFEKVPFGWK
jgi:hypothetical protein